MVFKAMMFDSISLNSLNYYQLRKIVSKVTLVNIIALTRTHCNEKSKVTIEN